MVKKQHLYNIAGLLWVGVSLMLIYFAWTWLHDYDGIYEWVFISAGLILAFIKYFLVFIKMADRNLDRISSMESRAPLYKVYTPGTYILIVIMMTAGIIFRKTGLPRACLASIDIAIGLGLLLGAVRFFSRLSSLKN